MVSDLDYIGLQIVAVHGYHDVASDGLYVAEHEHCLTIQVKASDRSAVVEVDHGGREEILVSVEHFAFDVSYVEVLTGMRLEPLRAGSFNKSRDRCVACLIDVPTVIHFVFVNGVRDYKLKADFTLVGGNELSEHRVVIPVQVGYDPCGDVDPVAALVELFKNVVKPYVIIAL